MKSTQSYRTGGTIRQEVAAYIKATGRFQIDPLQIFDPSIHTLYF